MSTQNTVTALSQAARPSELEFQKLSRQYRRAEAETLQFCVDFAASWKRLEGQVEEKQHLAELFGWSERRAQVIAQVGQDYPKKKALLEGVSPATPLFLPTSIEGMREIIAAPDETLVKLAEAGMFAAEPSKREIREAVKTGEVPRADVRPVPPRSPLDKLDAKLQSAESHLNHAYGAIAEALTLMEEHGISSARGLTVKGLQRAFEKLCAHMATANPDTYEKAIKILRGEE